MILKTSEAAEIKGCKAITIIKALETGRLNGKKLGRDWAVFEDQKFNAFKVGTVGRPKKVKP